MKRLLPVFLCVGLLVVGLTFNIAQAQNDLAPIGDGSSAVDLTPPVPLPSLHGGLLYDNGPLVNSPGTGLGGADESVLQNNSLLMSTLGAGHQVTAQNFMADDFTVPVPGWEVNEIVTYAYQTGGGPGASTMTQVHMCIWDGPPSTTPNLIWGDCATNVMNATTFSNILRVTETTMGTVSDRAIMR